MDKIILNGCRFYGYHGAFAEEQTLGQIFVVDLELEVDLTRASQSDNLADMVWFLKPYRNRRKKKSIF